MGLVHELLMQVSGWFRVVPGGSGWCGVVPGGSEWFRTICVESHRFSCFSFLTSLPNFVPCLLDIDSCSGWRKR